MEKENDSETKFPIDVKLLAVFIAICLAMALYDNATSETYSYCKSGHWMGKMHICDTTITVNKKTGKITKIEF